jgi:hypothetical protein
LRCCALLRPPLAALILLALATRLPAQSDAVDRSNVIPIAKSAPARDQPLVADQIAPGDSSRKQRSEATSQLPLDKLSPEAHAQVQHVLKNLSLYRRLPTVEIDADRRVYEFFTSRPDVAVSIWRAMGISAVQLWQTGPNDYDTDTRDGTIGTVQVLHRSLGSYVVLCKGQFQSPALNRPIQAQAIMHLQPRFNDAGKVIHHVDLFVSFPSVAVETIAKLISPVSYRIADRNFEEVSLFVEMMSSAMSRQPGWVEQISARLDGVLAGRSQELLNVTAAVYIDYERRRLAETGQPVTLEAIKAPLSVSR